MTTILTLSGLLDSVAASRPEATALVSQTRPPMSYAGFAAQARRVAEGLSHQGIGPGDRVAMMLPNRPEFLVLHLALARLGALVVHVNTRYRAEEVSFLLDRARPCAIITAWHFPGADFPALLASLLPDTRAPIRFVVGLDTGGAKELAGLPVVPFQALDQMPERVQDDATPESAALTFTTSGTTGGPKLVLHHQRSLAIHAQSVAERVGTGAPGAVALGAVPFCGTFGLAMAFAAMAGGAKIVCLDRWDVAQADALIRTHRVTHWVATDDMLHKLIAYAGKRPYAPMAFTGFASFHPGAEALVAPGDALGLAPRGVYGSSEVQALFSVQDVADPVRRRLGGGTPCTPGSACRTMDPESGAPMEHGELQFSGPSLFAGYLNNEAATAKAMTADGFFRSGDLGYLREGGFDFEARLGDALRLGGFLVAPEEVEVFLATQPGVQQAQFVAAKGGTVPVAFVVPHEGAEPDEAALIAACKAQLATFKVPARIAVIEAFPKTASPNGEKIQRVKLREMADALLAPAERAEA